MPTKRNRDGGDRPNRPANFEVVAAVDGLVARANQTSGVPKQQ